MKEFRLPFVEAPDKGSSQNGLNTNVNSGVDASVRSIDAGVNAGVKADANSPTVQSGSYLTPKEEAAILGKK